MGIEYITNPAINGSSWYRRSLVVWVFYGGSQKPMDTDSATVKWSTLVVALYSHHWVFPQPSVKWNLSLCEVFFISTSTFWMLINVSATGVSTVGKEIR